jgi:hypothetical protein
MGHNVSSSACGAAIGAYNFIKENPDADIGNDYLDC